MQLVQAMLYPLLLVMFGIGDYHLWKQYRKEGYVIPNFIVWFWYRQFEGDAKYERKRES